METRSTSGFELTKDSDMQGIFRELERQLEEDYSNGGMEDDIKRMYLTNKNELIGALLEELDVEATLRQQKVIEEHEKEMQKILNPTMSGSTPRSKKNTKLIL